MNTDKSLDNAAQRVRNLKGNTEPQRPPCTFTIATFPAVGTTNLSAGQALRQYRSVELPQLLGWPTTKENGSPKQAVETQEAYQNLAKYSRLC